MPVRLPFEHCVADLEKRLTARLVLPAEPTPTEHLRLAERIERILSVAPSILSTLLTAMSTYVFAGELQHDADLQPRQAVLRAMGAHVTTEMDLRLFELIGAIRAESEVANCARTFGHGCTGSRGAGERHLVDTVLARQRGAHSRLDPTTTLNTPGGNPAS
jgi:hypothetical protein